MISDIASETIRRRGFDYYSSGAVKKVFFVEKKVYAIVSGERDYQVVLFTDGRRLQSAQCNCPYFTQNEEACKHIVALLYYLQNSGHKTAEEPDPKQELIDKLLRMHADVENQVLEELLCFGTNENRNLVKLDYEIDFGGYHDLDFIAVMRMKIGAERMYSIRNYYDFLQAFLQKKPYEFGKQFVFNPILHDFAEEDKKMLEVLLELYRLEGSIASVVPYNSKVFFKGRNLNLNLLLLKKIASAMGEKRFTLCLPQKTMQAHFESRVPFSIAMESQDGKISVRSKDIKGSIVLDRNYNFILINDTVFINDESDPAYPIIKGLLRKNKQELVFSGENVKKLINMMPVLEKSANITIGQSMSKLYIKKPLKIQIYFDKYGQGISAKLKFLYGEHPVDPFDEKSDSVEAGFIVREYDKERHVKELLAGCGFRRNNDMLYLEDDDSIYIFIKDVVPRLAELGDLYYSSQVKHLFSIKSPKIKTSMKSLGGNLLEINLDVLGIDRKTAGNILKSIREKKRFFKLKSGEILSLEDENVKKLGEILSDIPREEIKGNSINISRYRMMGIIGKYRSGAPLLIENADSLNRVIDDIIESRNMKMELPRGLQANMREYQVTGFKWLSVLANNGLGGILADDMGLGKTLQAIALLLSAKEKDASCRPSLIVAPSTLVYNWESEIKKFAPSLKTLVVDGNKTTRTSLAEKMPEYDVVITSYPLIRNDIELYERHKFYCCILDEAQHIKNYESQNAKSVKSIISKARLALTGTPMENSPAELWSIFDFIMPGYLYSYKYFKENYQKPIIEGDSKALKELRKLIAPFVLRRTKKEVLKELPEKIETTLMVDMTPQQKKIYQAYLVKVKEELEERIQEEGFENSRMHIFSALLRLRQLCCHPALFIENYRGESGKMELLRELLDELLSAGHRVLLFSQFTSMLDIIKNTLDKMDIRYTYLDGSTAVSVRKKIISDFNSGSGEVFLLSLKAGGVGLNLTSADTVIHFDPWWNPAVEEQASDRAYRIGQKNNVQIFRLITKGTIEEKIDELQKRKRDLVGSIITEGEVFINSLTKEEVMELFKAGVDA
jgi:SNF2 family DNA or RNA helicase